MSRKKSKLFKRINWKSFGIGVVSVILTLVIFGMTSTLITNYFPKALNEDNLYTADCVTLEDTTIDGDLKITVKEKTGAIILDGKAANTAKTYDIGAVDLKAGTYTLTAIEDASLETVYVTITINQVEYNFDIEGENTITIESDFEDCVITLHVMADVEFDSLEILPVIVKGEKAADFYA